MRRMRRRGEEGSQCSLMSHMAEQTVTHVLSLAVENLLDSLLRSQASLQT